MSLFVLAMFFVVSSGYATLINLDLDSWETTSYDGGIGVLEETAYGLKINAGGYRIGHQIATTDTYNLVDTTISITWQGYGDGSYAQFGIVIPELGFSTGPYGGFSTGWSWSGSTVISDNTWYYTVITINADKTYEIISSAGDYIYNGGNIIRTSTGTIDDDKWAIASNATIAANIRDPYHGTVDYMGVSEVDLSSNTPIPEPTTICLMGFGLLGVLVVVIRQRRRVK